MVWYCTVINNSQRAYLQVRKFSRSDCAPVAVTEHSWKDQICKRSDDIPFGHRILIISYHYHMHGFVCFQWQTKICLPFYHFPTTTACAPINNILSNRAKIKIRTKRNREWECFSRQLYLTRPFLPSFPFPSFSLLGWLCLHDFFSITFPYYKWPVTIHFPGSNMYARQIE